MKLSKINWKLIAKRFLVLFSFAFSITLSLISTLSTFSPEAGLKNTNSLAAQQAQKASRALLPGAPTYEENRDSNLAPSTIYLLDSTNIGKNSLGDLEKSDEELLKLQLTNITDGFEKLGIEGGFSNDFENNRKDLGTYLSFHSITDLKVAEPAYQFYNSISSVNDNFNDINQIGPNTTGELKVFNPTNVLHINEVGETSNISNHANDSQYKDKIEYQVAKINVGQLENTNTATKFEFSNLAAGNKFDYRLTFAKDLYQKTKDAMTYASSTNEVMDYLLNSGAIILRDMNNVYDPVNPSSMAKVSDLLTIEFVNPPSGDVKEATIKIYLNPGADNIDESSALTLNVGEETITGFTTGFLDTNFASIYASSNYLNGATPPSFHTSDLVNDFLVHKNEAKQKEVTSPAGAEIEFWLGQNQTLPLSLYIDGDDKAFLNGQNEIKFSYTYDGANHIVGPQPDSLTLNKGSSVTLDSLKFNYSYEIFTVDGKNDYAKVKITYQKPLSINPASAANVLASSDGSDAVFWEIPGNNSSASIATKGMSGNDKIDFYISNDVSEEYWKYLGFTYGNWYDNLEKEAQWYLDPTTYDQNRILDFNYSYYYENDIGGIIGPENKNNLLNGKITDYEKVLLIHNEKGNFKLDDNQKILTELATGTNIAKFINNYYNRNLKWMNDKFNVAPPEGKEENYYLADPDPSQLINFVEDKLIKEAGSVGQDAINHAMALIDLGYKSYEELTTAQKTFIDSLDYLVDGSVLHSFADQISGKLKAAINPASGEIDWTATDDTTLAAIKANQLILLALEQDLAKVVEQIIKNEQAAFEIIYKNLLSNAMSVYLKNTNGNWKGISPEVLKYVDNALLSDTFKNSNVITLNGNPAKKVQSGTEQLGSLLDFIYNFSLQERYLAQDPNKINLFNTFYENGMLTNPNTYITKASDSSGEDPPSYTREQIGQMIDIVDEIIANIIGNDQIMTLNQIIIQLEQGVVVDQEAADLIGKSIEAIINKIIDDNANYQYQVLNIHATSSYLENLIIGHNLTILFKKWIALNEGKIDDATKSQLINFGLYDPKTIAKIGTSLEYYNIEYFLQSLIQEPLIPGTLDQLLKSDLTNSINFEIPETNSFINFVSNPQAIAKYSLLGLGIVVSLIGALVTALAFRQGVVQYLSKKASTSARMATVFIIVTGIILITIGAIL